MKPTEKEKTHSVDSSVQDGKTEITNLTNAQPIPHPNIH